MHITFKEGTESETKSLSEDASEVNSQETIDGGQETADGGPSYETEFIVTCCVCGKVF